MGDEVERRDEALSDERWTGRRMASLRLTDVSFVGCDLAGVTIDDGSLLRVRFERCRLSDGVTVDVLRGATLSTVQALAIAPWPLAAADVLLVDDV